ncbi:hypothetical protein AVEN_136016-1 [Araneus ventricosus]|uniref:Uncharacterized protein n=1 Tax=Araneus ventricosus TaxID=182803 RepID=A0A4Y2EX25_ARAVE|nr:hypothetical protein AVEN_136016-1 [Araneus ventricosus]
MHEFWTCRETERSILKFTETPLNVADLPLNFVLHFFNLPLNFFLYFICLPLDIALYFINQSFLLVLSLFSLVRIASLSAQLPFSVPIRLVQPSLPVQPSSLPTWQTAFQIVCSSIWSKVRSLAFTGKPKYPTSDTKCDKIDLWVNVNAVQ